MRIDVLLGEARSAPADVADRVVIVIDVLRAATTVAVALSNGAEAVRPFETVDETRAAAASTTSLALTAGERAMVRISGFDLGNSPAEYSRNVVEGRTILFTTTNGTAALVATRDARASFFAAFVNAERTVHAVIEVLRAEPGLAGVTIVCSGTDLQVALEDVVCAGRLARRLRDLATDASLRMMVADSARVAMLVEAPYSNSLAALRQDATHAHSLDAAGFASDVERCFTLDSAPVAVRFEQGALYAIEVAGTRATTMQVESVH